MARELTRLNLSADERRKIEGDLAALKTQYIYAESNLRLEEGQKWIDQQMHLLDLDRQHIDYMVATSQLSPDRAQDTSLFGKQGVVARQGALGQAVIAAGVSKGDTEIQAKGEAMMAKAADEFWQYRAKTSGTMRDEANREFKKMIAGITVGTDELDKILSPENADSITAAWENATQPTKTYASEVANIGKMFMGVSAEMGVMMNQAPGVGSAIAGIFSSASAPLSGFITQLQAAVNLQAALASAANVASIASIGYPAANGLGFGSSAAGTAGSYTSNVGIVNGQYVDLNAAQASGAAYGQNLALNLLYQSLGLPTGHTGGIVGDGAIRYHVGGFAGLKPGEVPSILMKDEEVKTTSDPFHLRNLHGTAMTIGAMVGHMIGGQAGPRIDVAITGNYIHPDMDLDRFADELADRPVKKADTKELKNRIAMARQEIALSMPFVVSQFNEQLDATVKEAKGEVKAFVQSTVIHAGLAALQGAPVVAIEDQREGRE